MNYELLKIGKEELPIYFGFNALRKYCALTGTSLNKLSSLGDDMTLEDALQLIWAGLSDGHRRAGIDYTLTLDDIGDYLDDDITILEKAMSIFGEQMGQNVKVENKKVKAKKKVK